MATEEVTTGEDLEAEILSIGQQVAGLLVPLARKLEDRSLGLTESPSPRLRMRGYGYYFLSLQVQYVAKVMIDLSINWTMSASRVEEHHQT